MRDRQLVVFIDLGERGFIGWVVKDRVVTKSATAGGGRGDESLDGSHRFKGDAIPVNHSQRAHEASRPWPLGMAGEPLEDLRESFRVRRIGTKKSVPI